MQKLTQQGQLMMVIVRHFFYTDILVCAFPPQVQAGGTGAHFQCVTYRAHQLFFIAYSLLFPGYGTWENHWRERPHPCSMPNFLKYHGLE